MGVMEINVFFAPVTFDAISIFLKYAYLNKKMIIHSTPNKLLNPSENYLTKAPQNCVRILFDKSNLNPLITSIVRCIPQSASSAHPCAEKGGSERSELAHARTRESRVKLFIPPLHKSNHNSSNATAKTITTDFNHAALSSPMPPQNHTVLLSIILCTTHVCALCLCSV